MVMVIQYTDTGTDMKLYLLLYCTRISALDNDERKRGEERKRLTSSQESIDTPEPACICQYHAPVFAFAWIEIKNLNVSNVKFVHMLSLPEKSESSSSHPRRRPMNLYSCLTHYITSQLFSQILPGRPPTCAYGTARRLCLLCV